MSDLLDVVRRLSDRVRTLEKAGSVEPVWATVTQTSPLRVRLDGDAAALPITPDSLAGSVEVGQRVITQRFGKQVVVAGPPNPGYQYFAPSMTPQSGAFGSSVVGGMYWRSGRTCLVSYYGHIIDVGTGVGQLYVTLPFPASSAMFVLGHGRELAQTGWMLQAVNINANTLAIQRYDGADGVMGSGRVLSLSVRYETAS